MGTGQAEQEPRPAADGHDDLFVIGQEIPPPSEVNDLLVAGAALVTIISAVVFAVGLLLGAPLVLYGSALALALFSLAIAVRRYFAAAYPTIEALEARALPEAETRAPVSEVPSVTRRGWLRRMLVAAAAVFGVSLAAPVASLGPPPVLPLRNTEWRAGRRLVTSDGRAIRPGDVATGGIATVWPDGAVGTETSAAVLVRLSTRRPQPPVNLDWVVDDRLLAYSKVCTHAGCPVGLFRERDSALFCPCHQSTFDAARGAVPMFGPAARPLPQLPLGVDRDGYLIALDDYHEQVGPAFG